MQKYLLSLFFILTTIFGWSQQTSLEWIEPKPTNGVYANTEKFLNIELKVNDIPPDAQYDILINGKSLYRNSKARIVPLNGLLTAKIPMLKVKNLVVTATTENYTYVSKSLSIADKIAPAPKLFALTIGATPPSIRYTKEDADDILDVLTSQQCGEYNLYSEVVAKKITGEKATANGILQALKEIANSGISSSDVFILFISSHGKIIDNEFYIQGSDYNIREPKTNSVAARQIYDILDSLSAKKLVFYDACESGGSKGANLPIQNYREFIMNSRIGYNVLTSSRGSEQSYYHSAWENGAFTEALVEGIRGKANTNNDEVITTDEIFRYVSHRVPELCKEVNIYYIQHPDSISYELGNFPFFNGLCTQVIRPSEIQESDTPTDGFHAYVYEKTGNKYIGKWKLGKREGEGLLFDNDGNLIYDGDWKNDLKDGNGIYYYEDSTRYIGQWNKDKKQGLGKFIVPDKGYYKGKFKNNDFCGYGVFYYDNGVRYEGRWKNNEKHGRGLQYSTHTAYYYGRWKDGILKKSIKGISQEVLFKKVSEALGVEKK